VRLDEKRLLIPRPWNGGVDRVLLVHNILVSPLPSHIHPEPASPPVDPAVLAGRFSPQSQRIAESLKVKDLLVQLIALEAQQNQDLPSRLSRLQVQQQLSNRILLAFLDVARSAAEADCEEERADQLADGLQEIRDQRIRRHTLIAIVGDAMIGIVSGGLGLALQETASEAVAILGGTVATWFGLGLFSMIRAMSFDTHAISCKTCGSARKNRH
jgi:hypothetical protein